MTDPQTIERVLFICPTVHVYAIPPLASSKGHLSAGWTKPPVHEFPIQRLRTLEASTLASDPPPYTATTLEPAIKHPTPPIGITILLEDPTTGDLFASAPYLASSSVLPALDSSRFFALTVVGDDGRKAVLGIGFEERSEAFDFSVTLQEARKLLGWEAVDILARDAGKGVVAAKEVRREWGLKEGEVLRVEMPRRMQREKERDKEKGEGKEKEDVELSGENESETFLGLLPPPPTVKGVRAERRRSGEIGNVKKKELEALGFDDGEFGEFQ